MHPYKYEERLACMRVPAEDVAAMTNPPVARPEMTPPPTAPDQIAMIKIATYSRGPSSFKASSFKAMLDKPICAYIIGGNCLKPAQKGYTLVLSTGPSQEEGLARAYSQVFSICAGCCCKCMYGVLALTVPYTELMSKSVRPVP